MKKKLRLINPSNAPVNLRGSIFEGLPTALYPSHGLLVLASMTPPDWSIEYLDESIGDFRHGSDVDLVAITLTTSKAKRAYHLADWYKEQGIPVILGGIHASSMPEEAGKYGNADVIGEGELVWEKLLSDFDQNNLKKFYKSSSFINLDILPAIKWYLIEPARYQRPYMIETSRGCPYNCEYCCSKFFGKQYRVKSLQSLINELSNIPGKHVAFSDDNIIGLRDNALKFFKSIAEKNLEWSAQSTITIGNDPTLLKAAAKSGCKVLVIGIDSVRSENFKIANKKSNQNFPIEDAIKNIQDHGIRIVGNFIFGFDADDERVFEETVRFCERSGIHAPFFWILTPYPDTGLYNRVALEGRIIDNDWNHYDSRHVVFKPARMSPEALLEGFQMAFKEAYSSSSLERRFLKHSDEMRKEMIPFNKFIKTMSENSIYYYVE